MLGGAINQRWRRVYAALILVECLVQRGCGELMSEAGKGVHFDMAQRLALLEYYVLALIVVCRT